MLTSGPRSCKNNKFVQIDHTHREIVCFAKFFNVMNVVYSFVAANSVSHLIWLQNQINKIPIMLKNIVRLLYCLSNRFYNRFDWRSMTAATIEIHFYYIKTYLKGLKDNRFQSFWCLFGVY